MSFLIAENSGTSASAILLNLASPPEIFSNVVSKKLNKNIREMRLKFAAI